MFSRFHIASHAKNMTLTSINVAKFTRRGICSLGYAHSQTKPALFRDRRRQYSTDTLYESTYRNSLEKPEEFWAKAAENIVWTKKYSKVLDNSNPPFTKWFVGGTMNTCYNAVDRHVEAGFGDQVAIIHDSPVTHSVTKITYLQLLNQVSLFADVLARLGVGYGDRVLIYMPMIPQAVVAMLASARLGAVHSLVFGGFASRQLSTRINHAQPKVVVSANCAMEPGRVVNYKPLLDRAIEMSAYKPSVCVIYNRLHEEFEDARLVPGRDLDWDEQLAGARPRDCVPVLATDPLYLLYTSGTTGFPKGVVRPSGGHAVALYWTMYHQYGVRPHEAWFSASDLGWVVGHSYIAYGPLLHCNTSVLYEGKPVGTPDPSAFYRVIHDHEVVSMFVAPTAMRALRKEDPTGAYSKKYPLTKFRSMFVAGEHCDADTMRWIKRRFNVPTLDNWWQTETGSAITSTMIGLNTDLNPPFGVAGLPVPGWNIKIMRSDKTYAGTKELGRIVAKLPLPPSCFSTMWRDDEQFVQTYFTKYPGYYDTMDAGYRDEYGNIAVMARMDDVINVAGHRLSSGQIEEAIVNHTQITEAAVVPVSDHIKGHVPVGICVLKTELDRPVDTIRAEVIEQVRHDVGPVAAFKTVIFVKRLPKTRSGKTARHTMAAMLNGQPFRIPVTIEDEAVYPELRDTFQKAGFTDVYQTIN